MPTWLKDVLIGAGGALLAAIILATNFESIAKIFLPDQVVPTGAVIAFTGDQGCPETGWRIAPGFEGRYMVGRHLSTVGNTIEPVGLQLTAGENRSVGAHTHGYTALVIANNGASSEGLGTEFNGGSSVRINVPSTAETSPSGLIDGTNAPYIAVFMCEKM